MRSWRRSAAYRIAFANFAAYAIGIAMLGAVVFGGDPRRLHPAARRDGFRGCADDRRRISLRRHGRATEAISKREAASNRMLYAVFTPDGRRIYGSLRTARPALGLHDDPIPGPDRRGGRRALDDRRPVTRRATGRRGRQRLARAIREDHPDRLRRRLSRHLPARVRRRDSAWRLSASSGCRSISNSAKAIIGGDIRQRMPVGPRRDEFDEVAITLNRMLDRIEGLLENLRQVSSDVAHDLRTPLSRLRTRLEQGVLEIYRRRGRSRPRRCASPDRRGAVAVRRDPAHRRSRERRNPALLRAGRFERAGRRACRELCPVGRGRRAHLAVVDRARRLCRGRPRAARASRASTFSKTRSGIRRSEP